MIKCLQCGSDFQGKFCPFCGTKRQEDIVCPKCGTKAIDGARFCSECGVPLYEKSVAAETAVEVPKAAAVRSTVKEKPPKPPKEKAKIFTEPVLAKIYEYLKYVSVALFALFAVLLFAFYAAPVAVMPGGEFMGEKIPSESYGNVYEFYGLKSEEFASLSGAMSALIIFAVFAALFAAVFAVVTFVPAVKGSKITLFGKTASVENLLLAISFAFYLLFLILGAVVAGKVNSADGGIGLIAAGACPTLIIVFSIIFAVLSVGSLIARYFLNKLFPTVGDAEIRFAEQKEKQRDGRVSSLTAPIRPIAPAEAVKPAQPAKPRYVKTAATILGRKRMLLAIFTFPILWAALSSGCIILRFGYELGGLFLSAILPTILGLLMIFGIIAMRIWGGRKGYKQFNKVIESSTYIAAIVISVFIMLTFFYACGIVWYENLSYYYRTDSYVNYNEVIARCIYTSCCFIPILVAGITLLITACVWYAKHKKFCLKMCGVKKPKKDIRLTEFGNAELTTVNQYNTAVNNYRAGLYVYNEFVKAKKKYKKDTAIYASEIKLFNAGIDYTKYPKPIVWLLAHKPVAVVAAAVVLAGIALAIALPPALAPKESLEDLISILLNIH